MSPQTEAVVVFPYRQVLLFGLDAALLSYRAQVLERSGFSTAVLCSRPLPDPSLLPRTQVAILCHTLGAEDRRRVTESLNLHSPSARIIALDLGHIPGKEAARYAATIENLLGPALLVKTVREQIALGQ